MRKNIVTEKTKKYISIYDLEGDVETAIGTLLAEKQEMEAEGYREIKVVVDGGFDGANGLEFWAERDETEAEKEKRLSTQRKMSETAKKIRAEKEAKEKKEYERLKAKFEKGE